MLRIVAITLIQGMLPAIFGLVFLWIKSDVTLIAPWPMLMLYKRQVYLLCEFADRCGRLEISRRYAERQAGASHTYVPCRFRAVIDL